ncbi:MAG: lamin tail domain-containing protein [Chloroflexota bacterium]
MQGSRRLIPFILLNILVSGLTTWLVVSLLMRNNIIPSQNGGVPAVNVQDNEVAPQQNTDGATAQPGQPQIVLDQLEINSVIGAGDLQNEGVQIRHIGDKELSLAGWMIRDENETTYIFPGLTMFSGGAVTVYTKFGVNTVVELYWGLEITVWEVGETVTLLDPDGNVQATFKIP